jgi:hypothetical protein
MKNPSVAYMLNTAFDYEIRNYIDLQIYKLNQINELDEKEADRLRELQMVREYLLKRIGEMT